MDKLYYLGKLTIAIQNGKRKLTHTIPANAKLHIYQYFEVR